MGFTIQGTFQGDRARVEWDAETGLAGDVKACAEIERKIRAREMIDSTSTGPFYMAGLDPEELAVLTVCSVFDPGYQLLGAPRQYPPVDLPPGAIA